MSDTWNKRTKLVHGGTRRSQYGEVSEAIFLTQGFVYDSAEQAMQRFEASGEDEFIYARYGNPTVDMFQERLAQIEGAEQCFATASGMSAVFTALISLLKAGDRLVASRALFGSCFFICNDILPRYGVETVFVDGTDAEQWREALSVPTAVVFLETPTNPGLDLIDLEFVAGLAKSAGAKLVIDNVFATPLLQKPIEYGADVIVYSATKHMDGQGRVLLGAILGQSEFIEEHIDPWLRHTGPAASPFNAWVVLKGLETLDLRVRQACANAAQIADAIADHPSIQAVRYPGRTDHPDYAVHQKQMSSGGTLVAFSVKGARAEAFKVLNSLQLVDISNNLGDTKSLACHPCSTTHRALTEEEQAEMGLDESWIRLSVGLEDAGDLSSDLLQALNAL